MRVSVGILAGGKSVRMGQDKFDLNFYGHTFIEELIDRFKDYEVIVSSNTADYSPIKTVKDTYIDAGPLSGILEILKNSTNKYVFVTSCDMINVKSDLVDFAASIASFSDEAVIFEADDRFYPTCGIFSKKIIPVVEEMLSNKDYRVMNLIKKINAKFVNLKYTIFEDEFVNINYPEELKKNSTPLICICGKKNSGKTTFIKKLVGELKNRGKTCSVIKHDGHDFELDFKDTDTFYYKEYGACQTLIFNDKYFKLDGRSKNIYDLIKLLDDVDLIIIEGMKDSDFIKYECTLTDDLVCSDVNKYGIISDRSFAGYDNFDINNPSEFTNYIIQKFKI